MRSDTSLNLLFSRILSGDQPAETELLSILRVRFVLLAKRRIGKGDAEDVAQEACVTIVGKCRELPPETNFAAWALQVLRNKIGNRLQQKSRRVVTDEEGLSTIAAPQNTLELESKLLTCLQQLRQTNPRYARVLNLIHLGFTADEISGKLRVSKENLYVMLNRSREQLRRCLKEGI